MQSVPALNRSTGRRRSIVRTVTIGGKFTEEEARSFADRAALDGMLVGEWARKVLLNAVSPGTATRSDLLLLTEVQSLRLLLVNSLELLLRGDRMSAEEFKKLIQFVRTNKRSAALEALGMYKGDSQEDA